MDDQEMAKMSMRQGAAQEAAQASYNQAMGAPIGLQHAQNIEQSRLWEIERKREVYTRRANALEAAIRTCGHSDKDTVVSAANAFLAFLSGAETEAPEDDSVKHW